MAGWRGSPITTQLMLLAWASLAAAIGPSWYSCDPSSCLPANNCQCPTNSLPEGLSPEDVPQFVVITHDDAVTADSNSKVRSITDNHKNPNGCGIGATWFVMETGTDCTLVKQLYEDNHEIATHTRHHNEMTLEAAQSMDFTDEIAGCRGFLSDTCGIPNDQVVGFRAPKLLQNSLQREVLQEAGFLYDASIIETFGSGSTTSPDKNSRLWPYTMDNGIPQRCDWMAGNPPCDQDERHQGLWEFPLYVLQDESGAMANQNSMDPVSDDKGDLYTKLVDNFSFNYNGNRAPFGIFVHAPWFTEETTDATNKFIDWALQQPNVWVVTIREVIEWMKNPVPATQMASQTSCGAPRPTSTSPPIDSPAPDEARGPASCEWEGHCLGDACATFDDCDGQLVCDNGTCGTSGVEDPSAPTPLANTPPSDCEWEGHCQGDPCSSMDDCDGMLSCSDGVCSA